MTQKELYSTEYQAVLLSRAASELLLIGQKKASWTLLGKSVALCEALNATSSVRAERGETVQRCLAEVFAERTEPVILRGKTVSAEKFPKVAERFLDLYHSGDNQDQRWEDVIELFGFKQGYCWFRKRPAGSDPETSFPARELAWVLAREALGQ